MYTCHSKEGFQKNTFSSGFKKKIGSPRKSRPRVKSPTATFYTNVKKGKKGIWMKCTHNLQPPSTKYRYMKSLVCNIYISINNQLAKNKCDKINLIESSYPMKARHLATFEIHQLKKGASHSWSSPDNLLIRLPLGLRPSSPTHL